jgi:glycosyltransferase involved in cell wall biosynthesis
VRLLVLNWQDRLNPQGGGAETHIHEVFGRLAGRGHEVTLLCSGWPGVERRIELDGMEVIRVGTRYTFSAGAPVFYRRELARRPFDLVVEALNKVPLFSPLWSGRRVVLLAHHLFGATAFREAAFPVAGMTWLLERPLSRVYRGLPAEAISRSTAEDLVARGLRPEDTRVIYPGIDLDFFDPAQPAERFAEPTFLYVGRLRRYKGVDLLITALGRLRDRGVPARLIVAGRGEWEPRLRGLAERLGLGQRVDFRGFVTEEEKRDLFRRAWANLFSSPKEGWGITNLEAAACGTPTIASDSPGLRESVVAGETGLLVPHGDVEALAGAMRQLASDRGRVEELGRGALAFARAFSWERTARETEAHLAGAVERRTGPTEESITWSARGA